MILRICNIRFAGMDYIKCNEKRLTREVFFYGISPLPHQGRTAEDRTAERQRSEDSFMIPRFPSVPGNGIPFL